MRVRHSAGSVSDRFNDDVGMSRPSIDVSSFWPVPSLLILALACVRAATRLRDLDLEIAGYAVSSPLGYIWLRKNPALTAVDWPAGSADFRFSLPMQAVARLVEIFDITPESTVYPFAFIQIVLMLVGFAYLVHVLFSHTPTTLILTVVLALSPVAGVNLGNFGAGIGNGTPALFYMWAHGFKFFALAFALRERYLVAALCAALATWSHLTLGLFMVAFIGFGMLATPRRIFSAHALGGMALYIGLVAPLVAMLVATAHTDVSDVSSEDWVLMSRLFNWHWHPVELGLFGAIAQIGVLPIGALALAYIVARRKVSAGLEVDRMLLAGIAGTLALTAVGIFFSEVWPIPFVMKLALQRSSELGSLVMLIYFVRDLVRRLEDGPLLFAFVAGWALAVLVAASPGLALLPIVLLGLADSLHEDDRAGSALWALLLLGGAVIATVVALQAFPSITAHLWTPFLSLVPGRNPDYAIVGGSWLRKWMFWAVPGAVATLIFGLRIPASIGVRAGLVGGLLVASLVAIQHLRWEDSAPARPRLAAFKAAQEWAAKNTPSNAVFLGDPAYAVGFREFSGRGWYGSAAELAHFATLYDSVPGLFLKGLERLKEFGVDPRAVDRARVTVPGGRYGISHLARQASSNFNAMPAHRLKDIAERHGARFLLVLRAARTAPPEMLKRVYANEFFDIYDLFASSSN